MNTADDQPAPRDHGHAHARVDATTRGAPRSHQRRAGKHADSGHELGVTAGLAALSLDALSSVAYGPEAMVLVLVAGGTSALRFSVPLTLVITGMLGLLVVSYTQVIAAHPEGGGAYAVAKLNLGRTAAMLAAASLVVDYVLTVAVSLAAGAASLGSVFPSLAHHLLVVSLIGLVVLTAVNMFGISESARLLMAPTFVFVISILAVIVVGAFRGHPVARIGTGLGPIRGTTAVGVVLILKAFASGCSAVTGVEAIANGVPAFRGPRVRTAQRTEISLGVLLAVMLVGLAFLIRAHHLVPRGGVTILAQATAGAFGTGWAFYVSNIAVALVLALAANTSFGGLPVLMSLLAKDHRLPHLLARAAVSRLWERVAAANIFPGNSNGWLWGWDKTLEMGTEMVWQGLTNALRMFTPGQLNPFGQNPLEPLLHDLLDLEAIRDETAPRLYVAATDVELGTAKVFSNAEIDVDVLLASSCIPMMFPAVNIKGRHYWDGGYSCNPSLTPLLSPLPEQLILIRAQPRARKGVPNSTADIVHRLHEIAFQAPLDAELRDLPERVRLHDISADDVLGLHPLNSKMNTERAFLNGLFNAGRRAGEMPPVS